MDFTKMAIDDMKKMALDLALGNLATAKHIVEMQKVTIEAMQQQIDMLKKQNELLKAKIKQFSL